MIREKCNAYKTLKWQDSKHECCALKYSLSSLMYLLPYWSTPKFKTYPDSGYPNQWISKSVNYYWKLWTFTQSSALLFGHRHIFDSPSQLLIYHEDSHTRSDLLPSHALSVRKWQLVRRKWTLFTISVSLRVPGLLSIMPSTLPRFCVRSKECGLNLTMR